MSIEFYSRRSACKFRFTKSKEWNRSWIWIEFIIHPLIVVIKYGQYSLLQSISQE